MHSKQQHRQSMRWLALWGTLLAVCFAAISASALYGTRQDAGQAARDASANLALMVATNIERDVERIDISLQAVIDNLRRPDIQGLSDELRHLVLFDRIDHTRGLGAVLVVDAKGDVIYNSSTPRGPKLNLAQRDYFQALRNAQSHALYIAPPIHSELTRLWVIPVARRITLDDGSFGGLVVGSMRVAHMERMFDQLELGSAGSLKLMRSDGTIMARFPEASSELGVRLQNVALFNQYPTRSTGHFDGPGRLTGVARLYAYHSVGTLPLVVVVGLAQSDIYAAWHVKALIIGLIMAASLIATVVLVWLLRSELQRRVAAERAASRNERRYRLLAENSVDTIVMSGADGRVSYISPAIVDVLGWTPADIEGKRISDFVHKDHLMVLDDQDTDDSAPATLTFPARHRDGEWIWLEARVRRLSGDIDGASYISNVRDVSGRKKAEQALEAANAQLQAMAATDALTNLANRRRFDETLDREWRRSIRDGTELALLLIDADHFKALNDYYGHQQGDVYLKSIAGIIQECIRRPGDMAARYGGEEFAVLLPRTSTDGALIIAEKIRCAVHDARIPHVKGTEGVMTVSIGVYSLAPADGQSAADLVKRADAALYAAKHAGRNRSCHFQGQALPETATP